MAGGNVKCGKCGLDLDEAAKAPSETPCPACGSIQRVIQSSVTTWNMSNYSLDTFVAQELSQLTECNAPDLSKEFEQAEHWITNFIMNSMFSFNVDQLTRSYIFMIVRRAQMGIAEYNLGRLLLLDYTAGPPEQVSLYFRSLFHFENAAALFYQSYDITRHVRNDKPFQRNDGSPLDRLNKLYNSSKHTTPSQIPATHIHAVWLTNDGLSDKDVSLAWDEFSDIIRDVCTFANALTNPQSKQIEGRESLDAVGIDDS
jgi:hypothetical protein